MGFGDIALPNIVLSAQDIFYSKAEKGVMYCQTK